MSNVNIALRQARKQARITQRELADMMGIGAPSLSDIERGRRQFGDKYLPLLPSPIREAVAAAIVAESNERIRTLMTGMTNGSAE